MGTVRDGAAGVVGLARRGWRAVAWYVAGVTGESDYQRYVAHLRRRHPGTPVPSVGQYWRERYAEEDVDPGARCC